MKIEKYNQQNFVQPGELNLGEPVVWQNPIQGSARAMWEAHATRDLIGWGLNEAEGRALAGEIKFGSFRNLRLGRRAANLIEDSMALVFAEVETVRKLEEWGLELDTARKLFAEFKFHSIANVILQSDV